MMKKVLLGFLLLISGIFLFMNIEKYKAEIIANEDLAVYVNEELVSSIPKKGEAMFIKAVCDNNAKASWDNDKWGLLVTNMTKKTKCNLYFYEGQTVFDFDYTGSEQVFTVPVSGTYKLETWGAEGGYTEDINIGGGRGSYSNGFIKLSNKEILYLNVGGHGEEGNKNGADKNYGGTGGYNGGGNGGTGNGNYASSPGGGGATHIALKSGLLSTLENSQNNILIVSGGGGGNSAACVALGGSGGGFKSNHGSNNFLNNSNVSSFIYTDSANQNFGYSFGKGADGYSGVGGNCGCEGSAGGGGGFYGGYSYEPEYQYQSNTNVSGAGGSGYIGNHLLKDKVMYCYNCEESGDESTKTISTTCNEETPTENCAKKGNGYARITLVSIDE